MSDDFDISKFVTSHGKTIAVGTVPSKPAPKKRRKSFEAEWVKFPARWAKALQQSKSAATYQLALAILFEAFRQKKRGGEIVLSSVVTGMSKETRRRAANELIEFNLIEVERKGHRALRVTKMHIE